MIRPLSSGRQAAEGRTPDGSGHVVGRSARGVPIPPYTEIPSGGLPFPIALAEMMKDGDPVKLDRVMKALLQMVKLDVNALKRAYEGK